MENSQQLKANSQKLNHTIAHELAHGAFGLEHPWQSKGTTQGNTYNLLDYTAKTPNNLLRKYQWYIIHNPKMSLFGGDEEEVASTYGSVFIKGIGLNDVRWKEFVNTVNKLLKDPLFNKLYQFIKKSGKKTYIYAYSLSSKLDVQQIKRGNVNGYFSHRDNKYLIKFSPGVKKINGGKPTFNSSATICEEIFHNGQAIYESKYPYNSLIKETEAKIAKSFIYFSKGGQYANYDGSYKGQTQTPYPNWAEWRYNDAISVLYFKGITDYFNAINKSKDISKLNPMYRKDVKKYSKEVYDNYSKNRNEWIINWYNCYKGETPLLDYLLKN